MSAPRSLWNGSILIGRLVIPIKLHSAVQDQRVSFKQVHRSDLAPVEYRRFCSSEDREVPWDEIRKGLELDDGTVVLFETDELSVVSGGDKTIEIEGFVDPDEVEDAYLDRPYLISARGPDRTSYPVVARALASTGRAGIGQFAFHGRRRTALISSKGNGPMELQTLRPAAAVVPENSLEPVAEPRRPIGETEKKAARKLVAEMSRRFDPDDFPDRHRTALLELIEAKAEGELPRPPAKRRPERQEDLTEALEASLEAVAARRSGVPA